MNRKFLLMWDMYGLEAIYDVSKYLEEHEEWEKKKVWATLSESKFDEKQPTLPLQQMILRAKFNNQRHYEIYTIESELDEDEIKYYFKKLPQEIVNIIRESGYKIYSDRATKEAVIS